MELIAPVSLAPGASVQLRIVAHRTDGSQLDVTSTGRFISQSPETIAVSPNGVAAGLKLGESRVSGDNGEFSNGREIVVVPAGTFRVVGQVIEEDTSNLPVGGVRVETISGASGNSTDLNGQYRLYGVPPPRICVSARTDI